MTDYELICVGFFIGIFFSMIMIGVGVAYDTRFIKRKRDIDNDVRIYVPGGNRNRGGNNRRLIQLESEIEREAERLGVKIGGVE